MSYLDRVIRELVNHIAPNASIETKYKLRKIAANAITNSAPATKNNQVVQHSKITELSL